MRRRDGLAGAKAEVKRDEEKPLELAFVRVTSFQDLAKQKNVEVRAVSRRHIKYQLNKDETPVTDPITVVPAEYHEFLDVFSKQALDIVAPHSKYDHNTELLDGKNARPQPTTTGIRQKVLSRAPQNVVH